MNKEFEEWLLTRPPIIQQMGRKWPPGQYRIAEGAPYALTCPGTIVDLMAYNEDGTIRVVVLPENIRQEAKEHSNALLRPQGRDFSEMEGKPISAYVDPQFLNPL